MEHVIDQAHTILKNRKVSALFTTPKLLEALADRASLVDMGIKGVFAEAQPWIPIYPILVEEIVKMKSDLFPFGNTPMDFRTSHSPLRTTTLSHTMLPTRLYCGDR